MELTFFQLVAYAPPGVVLVPVYRQNRFRKGGNKKFTLYSQQGGVPARGILAAMDSSKRPRIRVAVALLNDDEELLLVEHTKAGRSYWLLPGGGLEWGEGIKDAAAREVEEETGFECQVGQLVLVSETVAPDLSRHLVHLVFCAKLLGGERRVPNNEERITDVAWVPFREVPNLVLHPPMQEAFAAMEISRLKYSQSDSTFLGNLWVD